MAGLIQPGNNTTPILFAYCYICQKVTSEPLVKNPTNHRRVLGFITERAAYGDSVYIAIKDKLANITIKTLISCCATFHGSCYRRTVHAGNYKRIKEHFYKINPRKRPSRKVHSSSTKATTPTPLAKCLLCVGRHNRKNNPLITSRLSASAVEKVREAVVGGLCPKIVRKRLSVEILDRSTILQVCCHQLCWNKHITKHIGDLDMQQVRPEDEAQDEFLKYLQEKLSISKYISLAMVHRAYQNIQKKHHVKFLNDRKKLKQLIKGNLSNVLIRRKHKRMCEMVSLVSRMSLDTERDESVTIADGSPNSKTQYMLRSRTPSLSPAKDNGICEASSASRSSDALINFFPDEILLKIFAHLDTTELGRSVLPVCKRWRKIGWEPSMWQDLVLARDELSRRRSCLHVISNSPQLRSLTLPMNVDRQLHEIPAISDIVTAIAENCPLLTHLSMPGRPSVPVQTLHKLVLRCPLIEYINFRYFIDDDNILIKPEFLLPLVQLKHLKTLCIGHSRFFFGDLIVRAIADHCTELKILDIAGFLMFDDTYRHLITKLRRRLKTIGFSPCILNKEFALISTCVELEEIYLKIGYHASICEEQLPCLRSLTKLKALHIQFVDMGHNTELSQLFREPTFANLEIIELNGYHDDVNDDFLNLLGFTMPCLMDLTLTSMVRVTDVGLGKLLRRCRDLAKLRLIEMDGLTGSALEKHGKNLPLLKLLEITRCPRISSLVINQLKLKKTFKNVEIVWQQC